MRKIIALFFIVFLLACEPQAKPVSRIVVESPKEILSPLDVSQNPKYQEVLEFDRSFLSGLAFPPVAGVPAAVDRESFQLVGLTVDGNLYTTTVQFKLRTFKGPVNKQYTLMLEDQGNTFYEIKYIREDK